MDVQVGLPFGEAEGTFAERERLLLLALRVTGADLHLVTLMRNVFHATAGGISGGYKKSYEELAATPYGLCCSTSTAKRVGAKAVKAGWLEVTPTEFARGGYAANEYAIVWESLQEAIDLTRGKRRSAARRTPNACDSPARIAQIDPGYGQIEPGIGQSDHSIKEYSSLSDSSLRKSSSSGSVTSVDRPAAEARRQAPRLNGGWEEAEDSLRRAGVRASREACRDAQRRGLAPADVLAIVGEYDGVREQLGGGDTAGAILFRLRNGVWPRSATSRAETERDERAKARQATSDAERRKFDADRRQADEDARRLEFLEAEHGGAIDGAGDDELAAVLEQAGEVRTLAQCRRTASFGRASPLLRGVMLEAWAASVQGSGCGLRN